ncbi:MAG TPA: SURF1 family protein [Burkholderiaceae bacterium]|jgi:surfeit locus 1 family protein
MTSGPQDKAGGNSRRILRVLVLAFGVLMVAVLVGLGTWQLFRLQWKLNLIARVEQRVHATPVPAPGIAHWPSINAVSDEYRRVQISGIFRDDQATLVQAVTELGGGYWVMTPLVATDGSITLINRGFIPREQGRAIASGPTGSVTITGLLRMTEPHGGFLRRNDPSTGRWYSRDVAAIAAAHKLDNVAPYFIDADAMPKRAVADLGAQPTGGLTVVAFHNNHLVYAITWYVLALMLAAACWHVGQEKTTD